MSEREIPKGAPMHDDLVGDTIDFNTLVLDTASYWGIEWSEFTNGLQREAPEATRTFEREWRAAKSRHPDNTHLAYVDAIRDTTRSLCREYTWKSSAFPKVSNDQIGFKAVTRTGDQVKLANGTGPRSVIHATYDHDPNVLEIAYWELDEDEPTLQLSSIDPENKEVKIIQF